MSFDPTTYTVPEGEGVVANLKLVRSGDLTRTVVITVTAATGTAMGMNAILVVSVPIFLNGIHMLEIVPYHEYLKLCHPQLERITMTL